jgi:hypothetical protein
MWGPELTPFQINGNLREILIVWMQALTECMTIIHIRISGRSDISFQAIYWCGDWFQLTLKEGPHSVP